MLENSVKLLLIAITAIYREYLLRIRTRIITRIKLLEIQYLRKLRHVFSYVGVIRPKLSHDNKYVKDDGTCVLASSVSFNSALPFFRVATFRRQRLEQRAIGERDRSSDNR